MSVVPPLVILHKQLGDVLLLEPALRKLAGFAGQSVWLATRPNFFPLLDLMTGVKPFPGGWFRRASQIISFDHLARASLQSMATFAPDKRLFVMSQKRLHAWHRLCFPQGTQVVGEGDLYRAEYYYRLVPGADQFTPPVLKHPPQEWMPSGLSSGYVLIHPTSAWKNKCWPANSWAKAIDNLCEEGFGPFVVTGGHTRWEEEFVKSIEGASKAPLQNLCGKTDLRSYLAVIANASKVLCVDGSAAHLAAAFGRPTVVMFGPSHPMHWYWPARHTRLLDARAYSQERRPSASLIPVEALLHSVRDLTESV